MLYSAAWGACVAGGIAYKHPYPASGYAQAAGVLVGWALFELLRLYCGFAGNLQEKVPVLVAFVLLTVFPVLPLVGYFHLAATGSNSPTPLDKVRERLSTRACARAHTHTRTSARTHFRTQMHTHVLTHSLTHTYV